MPLLEVVTRCYKRPQMLLRNVLSLQKQSDSDWEQTFLVDDVGLGVGASYKRLAHHAPVGEWVWILDDDDECIYPELVAAVRRIAETEPQTLVIMVRMDHGAELGILPDEHVWRKGPMHGHLGCSSYIVRRDVWQRHAHAFTGGHYASDFDFINEIWMERPQVHWLDVVASATQNGRMRGAAE